MKKGWEIKTWQEVLEIRSGRNQKEVLDPDGEYPILGSAGKVMGYANRYICNEGTTIIGRKGTIDNPLFINTKFWNVDTAFGLVAGDSLDKRYLYYFCFGFNFKELDKGTTLPSLVKKDLAKVQIPIPPLTEQKQIVAILDKAFAAIDQVKANIEKNIQNAQELFQSKLNEIFSQKGDGWEEKTLGEVYDVRDGTHDSPKYQDKGFPLITSKNLKNNSINYDKVKFISKDDYDHINKRSKVDKGDVLFAMIGTIGNPVVITEEPKFSIKNVALFKVPTNENSLFLKYYLESVLSQMIREAKGSTQKFVGLGYLRKFKINIPPLHVQNQVAVEQYELEDKINKLEEKYFEKIRFIENLKNSILQKAFAGELT